MIEEEIQKEAEYQQKLESAAMNRRQRKPAKQETQPAAAAAMQSSSPSLSNNKSEQGMGYFRILQPPENHLVIGCREDGIRTLTLGGFVF